MATSSAASNAPRAIGALFVAAAICLAVPAGAQTQPAPVPQPDPVETPIGTEANAPPPPTPQAPSTEPPATITFKVATWNLAAKKDGEAAAAGNQAPVPQKNWRHTFGAERTTAEWLSLIHI